MRSLYESRVSNGVQAMRVLSRDRIVSVVEYFRTSDGEWAVVMEYLGDEWVDLYVYTEIHGVFDDTEARDVFRQVVDVVTDIFSKGYIHNDVKGTLV
jgi:serine/threonine protein kinase